ncbi:hypothetical protein ESZ50_02370 [Weissella muntiaci]|uniref:WxL domain-containing protein n=1 Tax=Weissella muntiaci TaxID=2508881 RepID=A0A6C2CB27_9LACO|nr:hypothetical protein [Weissella muntiaci]TYC50533.1 hypothetical protein ESZ50_02370 [Weissella muntiaci]
MFKKRNIILFLVMIIGLVSLPSQQVHAAYTSTGWDYTNIPAGSNGSSYDSVNPKDNLYANSVGAVPIRLASGTTPTASFTYTPEDASKDPWYGGNIKIGWQGIVSADITLGTVLNIWNGLGFVANVNLPETIYSGDVQDSINNAAVPPVINIAGVDVTLSGQNFVPIGPHTLRLTLTKNNIQGIAGKLVDIASKNIFNLNNLPINFSITVPVKDITKNGAWNPATKTYYTGAQKTLTQNRFPPMVGKTDEFSVDFYGYDDIREGGTKGPLGFNIFGTGNLYAKLNADNTFMSKNRVYPTNPIKSWDQYISPSDNTGYYNTATTSETVDGSNKEISDFSFTNNYLRNYNLNLDVFNGTWDQVNQNTPSRFDRIVNFFTQKSTSGGTVSHTPTTGGSIGSTLPVQYTGKDSDGTTLSPVQVNVGEKYQTSDIKANGVTTYGAFKSGSTPTAIQSNKPTQLSISWKAPSLKSGKIVYSIVDNSFQNNVPETTFVSKISNTADTVNTYQTVTGTIPGLKPGNYAVMFKIVDDDYPTQNAYMSIDNSAYLASLDTPKFDVSNIITNERTNASDSSSINALWGDTIDEKVKYSVTDTGQNTLKDQTLTITTPKNTSFVADSLSIKVNGSSVDLSSADYSKISSGMNVTLNGVTFKSGDTVDIAYKYKVGNVSNQTINTIPVVFNAKAQFTDASGASNYTDLLPITSQQMAIKLPAEGLLFVSAPSSLSFGTVNRPYQSTDFPTISKNLQFVINNTMVGTANSNWQLSATLSQEFHTSSGQTLNSEFANLTYNDGKSTSTIKNGQTTPIYNGSGKGEQTFSLDNRFKLHVDPNGLNLGLTNDTYTSQITWNLSNGPTS